MIHINLDYVLAKCKLFLAVKKRNAFVKKYGHEYVCWLQSASTGITCPKCAADISMYFLPPRNCGGRTVMGKILFDIFDEVEKYEKVIALHNYN
jgi:hypothetical protein